MFGELLKQMRRAKGLSLRSLAKRAGIAHSTLSSWERGVYQPRLPELEAALKVLDASSAQRRRALALMDAPRAVIRRRAEAGESRAGFVAAVGTAPCGGDLLRAMRLRQGLPLETVARGIGVRASTLSRWERSEMWPEADHLHALCFLLHAEEEEVLALTCERCFQLPVALDESAAPEQWAAVVESVYRAPDNVRDLRFLSLETQLWHLSARRRFALPLLQRTYSYRARALMERNRFAEVDAYVERALNLAEEGHTIEDAWVWAIIASAANACHQRRRTNAAHAAQILGDWMEAVQHPHQKAWMLSERAVYLAQAGQTEEAVALNREAIRFSERHCPDVDTLFRWRDHARILTLGARYGEALDALEAASQLMTLEAEALARHRLLEAQCLLGVNSSAAAQESVQNALQVIVQEHLFYLQPLADTLARNL